MRTCLLLLLMATAAAGCASYRIAIEPPAPTLAPRELADRPPLTFDLHSTYTPFVDGELSTTELYPRDQELGLQDRSRYLEAFERTRQFAAVSVGPATEGVHCEIAVVSGREPAGTMRCVLAMFTLGLMSVEQREIVRLVANVSGPARAPSTYRLEARITTDAVTGANVQLRRSPRLDGPDYDIVAALVAHMAKDGWLDHGGAR